MSSKNEYVLRVNQIDAIFLNKEITRLIRDNLMENLQALSPALFVKIRPELDLLIRSAIWFGSVGKKYSHFGQQLLVLSYDSDRIASVRLYLHLTLTVLPSYIKYLKIRHISSRVEWLHKAIECSENAVLALSVLNFFRFLKTGRNPTLVDYILSLDYISLRNNQRRDIGYKYLTRELLWGGFMEILGQVLPIINFRKTHRFLKNMFLGKSPSSNILYNYQHESKLEKNSPQARCSYCGDRPTLPHHMGCGHIYCYFCLAANIFTDSKFICTSCSADCNNTVLSVATVLGASKYNVIRMCR